MPEKNNTLSDLNDHLFKQLERLNDPSADVELELKKAKASVDIGNVLINSAKVTVDAMRLAGATRSNFIPVANVDGPKQLEDGK